MASYRIDKMASTIRTIVSNVIHNELSDPRISPMTSVIRVDLSPDLQLARIHVSVMGDDATRRKTMAGLQNAQGRIQRLLAKRLTVRTCPHISLLLDESIRKTAETLDLINRLSQPDANDPPPADVEFSEGLSEGALE